MIMWIWLLSFAYIIFCEMADGLHPWGFCDNPIELPEEYTFTFYSTSIRCRGVEIFRDL